MRGRDCCRRTRVERNTKCPLHVLIGPVVVHVEAAHADDHLIDQLALEKTTLVALEETDLKRILGLLIFTLGGSRTAQPRLLDRRRIGWFVRAIRIFVILPLVSSSQAPQELDDCIAGRPAYDAIGTEQKSAQHRRECLNGDRDWCIRLFPCTRDMIGQCLNVQVANQHVRTKRRLALYGQRGAWTERCRSWRRGRQRRVFFDQSAMREEPPDYGHQLRRESLLDVLVCEYWHRFDCSVVERFHCAQ